MMTDRDRTAPPMRERMPVLARHEGIWEGTYTVLGVDGRVLDEHASRVTCRLPEDGPYDYHQINQYTWPDGRTQEFHFPATYHDGRIWLDTDRLSGQAWEADDRTILLTWSYKADPGTYLYEMIHLSRCGAHRARTWHWFERDVLVKRTLIREERARG